MVRDICWSPFRLHDENRCSDKRDLDKFGLLNPPTAENLCGFLKALDIPRSCKESGIFCSAITHFSANPHLTDNEALNYTLRQPIGNYRRNFTLESSALSFHLEDSASACCRNCVIAKPSEITPLTAFMLSEICIEAKLLTECWILFTVTEIKSVSDSISSENQSDHIYRRNEYRTGDS